MPKAKEISIPFTPVTKENLKEECEKRMQKLRDLDKLRKAMIARKKAKKL
jgi:hypothetical protein